MKALERARALVPEIVARHADALPHVAGRTIVSRARVTSTGMAILVLSPPDEPPCAIIKMPLTPGAIGGLTRETSALIALHADDRLGRWRDLVPEPRAHGDLRGQGYRIDSAVPGRPLARAELQTLTLSTAAAAIGTLHRATATTVECDSDLVDRWVDGPLDELARHAHSRSALATGLARLRDELREAVTGRTFSASWIHGDYWLGNLLFSSDGSLPVRVDGVVDWESSAPLELPLHDVLHLLLYTRRLRTGRELGHIVRDQLIRGGWSTEERLLLEGQASWCRDGSFSERHALLLYWLRHAALHTRQQTRAFGCRYWWWRKRAVLPVLVSL